MPYIVTRREAALLNRIRAANRKTRRHPDPDPIEVAQLVRAAFLRSGIDPDTLHTITPKRVRLMSRWAKHDSAMPLD